MSIGSFEIAGAEIAGSGLSGDAEAWLSENVTLTAATAEELVHVLIEAISLTDTWVGSIQAQEALAEGVTLAEAIQLVFKVTASENVDVSVAQAVSVQTIANIIEQLTINGLALGPIQAIYQIAAAMTIDDLLEIRYDLLAEETVTVSATISELFYAHVAAVESALISANILPAMIVMATAAEGITLSDSLANTLQAQESLAEGIEIAVQITLADGIYWAYVLNTESKAASNYVNFPYNSFAKIEGKYYGARDNGIWLLEGADDGGAQIDAHIRSGLMDFNSTHLKRLKTAYIGYVSDGRVVLKIIDTADGAKTERHYELVSQTADTYREARRKLGRGIKSRYWGFELENIDGADFDLESIQFMPIMLTRRLNSG